MKQYYEEKVRRNRIILENLNTEKSPNQLTKIVYSEFKDINLESASNSKKTRFKNKKRLIYNDLKFLLDLNIIGLDELKGTYQKAGVKKKIFRGAELDMAIQHAKNLIIETNSFAIFGTPMIVDYLAFNEKVFNKKIIPKAKQILDHLKTGYPEIYETLKEYQKMVNESDYIPDCTKPHPIPTGSYRELPKYIATVKEKLVGQFELRIMELVKEGQPLLGECEQCPDKRFKIFGPRQIEK